MIPRRYRQVKTIKPKHFQEIFYAAGHTGVLYDFENNSQRLLQGHV